MMMSKAIILPFFLLAGIASGSQQPQGTVSNTYYDEDDEGGSSLQRRTAPYEEEVEFGSAGAANLEDEYAVHSTTTDVYDDHNADEEVVDRRNRRQLRGNNNRRLNKSRPECRVGDPFNNCPSGETCWRRWVRVGSTISFTGNGVCVRNGACLPSGVFVRYRSIKWMRKNCCSGAKSNVNHFHVCR